MQDAVDRILGRLLTDARFRLRFFTETDVQLAEFDLVEHERESLRKLEPETIELLVELLADRLDPRIRRG